jgi:hypothetical protein
MLYIIERKTPLTSRYNKESSVEEHRCKFICEFTHFVLSALRPRPLGWGFGVFRVFRVSVG